MVYPRHYATIGAGVGAAIGIIAAISVGNGPVPVELAVPILAAVNWLSAPFGLILAFPLSVVTGSTPVGLRIHALLVPTLNWALLGFCAGYWRSVRDEVRARKNPRPSV